MQRRKGLPTTADAETAVNVRRTADCSQQRLLCEEIKTIADGLRKGKIDGSRCNEEDSCP